MEQQRVHIFVLINLYVNQVCIVYILLIYPLHRKITIHQPNNTDVVFTIPDALGRWSHKF